MPDWRQLVRERLPPLALPGPREEEIREELAQELEQSYDDARSAGAGEAAAMACALAQIGDWRQLAAEIVGAELDAGMPPVDEAVAETEEEPEEAPRELEKAEHLGGATDGRRRAVGEVPAAGPRPPAAAPAAVPAGRRRRPMGRAWTVAGAAVSRAHGRPSRQPAHG